jgi:hypothetical protein
LAVTWADVSALNLMACRGVKNRKLGVEERLASDKTYAVGDRLFNKNACAGLLEGGGTGGPKSITTHDGSFVTLVVVPAQTQAKASTSEGDTSPGPR